MNPIVAVTLMLLVGCGTHSSAVDHAPQHDLVGTPASEFSEMEWLNSSAKTMRKLRGRVVLVRFWTETCPFCRASAPALRQLHDSFAEEGLTVIGLYHPKPRGSTRSIDAVKEATQTLRWPFPVAIDQDWKTIDAWWLSTGKRKYTSASLLFDKTGVIRYVHEGPEFHPGGPESHVSCRRDFKEIEAMIETLVDE